MIIHHHSTQISIYHLLIHKFLICFLLTTVVTEIIIISLLEADRPWGPPSLLYNGYRVFLGGKVRPGRAAEHSPPSSAEVLEE